MFSLLDVIFIILSWSETYVWTKSILWTWIILQTFSNDKKYKREHDSRKDESQAANKQESSLKRKYLCCYDQGWGQGWEPTWWSTDYPTILLWWGDFTSLVVDHPVGGCENKSRYAVVGRDGGFLP